MKKTDTIFTITTIIMGIIIILPIVFLVVLFLADVLNKQLFVILNSDYIFLFFRFCGFVLLPLCCLIQIITFIIQLFKKSKSKNFWIKLLEKFITIIVCGFVTLLIIILIINPIL